MNGRSVLVHLAATVLVLSLASAAQAGDAEKGKVIYGSRCAFCHGVAGKGDGVAGAMLKPPATNFTNPDYWKIATAESMKAIIENGKPGTGMVSFKASLSPEQVDDLAAYLQTFKPHN